MMFVRINGDAAPTNSANKDGADRAYYLRRSFAESMAARAATCPEARLAHEEMARAYRILCADGGPADRHLASELSECLLNPEPVD